MTRDQVAMLENLIDVTPGLAETITALLAAERVQLLARLLRDEERAQRAVDDLPDYLPWWHCIPNRERPTPPIETPGPVRCVSCGVPASEPNHARECSNGGHCLFAVRA